MRFRAWLALALAFGWLALLSPAAPALAYPPTTCPQLSVSTTTPAEGETITVTGAHFDPNSVVKIYLHSATYLLATVTADSAGAFATPVKMPPGVTGAHVIFASGGQSSCPADPIDILIGGGSTSPSGGGGPAMTGVDIAGLLAIAAGLIAVGVALNRRSTRRRSHHARHSSG